jgi:hypothetical protein
MVVEKMLDLDWFNWLGMNAELLVIKVFYALASYTRDDSTGVDIESPPPEPNL